MAKIRQIKRRIKAAKNISQITRAMEMVAASKMKKSQKTALSAKPYGQKIQELTNFFLSKIKIKEEKYPLLLKNEKGERILVVLISTNKGLCGGLNTVLFRAVNQWFPDIQNTDFVTFGLKGRNFVLRSKRNLIADFSGGKFLENIGALTDLIVSGYAKERKYRQVFLVYNNFVSVLKQEPTKDLLLPIGEIIFEEEVKEIDFLIEPSLEEVLNSLLPHYLEVLIRRAIIEAEASEYSARMMAMKAATDNARGLIEDLTLQYNKERQQVITYEIADIITAKEAIE